MTVSDLIKMAFRKIGVLSSGESPETTRLNEALLALQVMLRAWSANGITIYAATREEITLISGVGTYTWGSGGTVNTERPNTIHSAYLLSGTSSLPINIIDERMYRAITSKETTGTPLSLLYRPSYPLASLVLYPVPDSAFTLVVFSYKLFIESSSFTLASDTISFPAVYQEPIVYNLSIRLAPEYGKTTSEEVRQVASQSYINLISLNASNQLETVKLDLPAGFASVYDINGG